MERTQKMSADKRAWVSRRLLLRRRLKFKIDWRAEPKKKEEDKPGFGGMLGGMGNRDEL